MRVQGSCLKMCASGIHFLVSFILLFLLAGFQAASADVSFDGDSGKATQTVSLSTGWNSVYLWVNPEAGAIELSTLLANYPQVKKVATYTQPVSRATMTENDSENFTHNAGWKIWRSESVLAKVNTLKGLLGARGYLFYAEEPVSFDITGEYVDYDDYVSWVGDRFNFQSFPVQAGTISFASYLASHKKLDKSLVYGLAGDGSWSLVNSRALIDPEKAYWVYCHNGTDFVGNAVRDKTPILLSPVADGNGGTVYEADIQLFSKTRSPLSVSLLSDLPLTAKVVRPGQDLNVADDPYSPLASLNPELSDQTSTQTKLSLQLPASAVGGQLNQYLELKTTLGDRKFYPLAIEGEAQ